jgi:lysyl-tRNA synthetase class II
MLLKSHRFFSIQLNKLPTKPYFAVNHSLTEVMSKHSKRDDLPDSKVELKTGGRIIGRRKAGSGLMFLDLESNGTQVQIMLEQKHMLENTDFEAVR